jgi:predicted GH43/DUF377 family glycosyl hydrolase
MNHIVIQTDIAIKHCPEHLLADPTRVVLRPFNLPYQAQATAQGTMSRTARVYDAVCAMSRTTCKEELEHVNRDFTGRHMQIRDIFFKRFEHIRDLIAGQEPPSEDHAALIGAYFSHEYAYEAAAVMNPSIVPHPNQTGIPSGSLRFVMSMRTVGEGHISTISFREGTVDTDGNWEFYEDAPLTVAADPGANAAVDGPVTVCSHPGIPISGIVIFPTTRAQSNGLEDLRMLCFTEDDGRVHYWGTYTAYSGREIGCEFFETEDFNCFHLQPFRGAASQQKGLALFPRRINGRFAAIGRLDHESLYYLESDDVHVWNYGDLIASPKYGWELIQMGNCGSPIELEEGWLVLTHGVGAMRRYALGAILLDKTDPRKVIGRTQVPLIAPSEDTREGYVPNVIYTCGAMLASGWLYIPYGVADSALRFASIRVEDMLRALAAE